MPSTDDRDPGVPPPQPAPTIWPVTIAAGLTLLAWGAVTSPIFSAVGALALLAGIAGWIRELRRDALAGQGRGEHGARQGGSDE